MVRREDLREVLLCQEAQLITVLGLKLGSKASKMVASLADMALFFTRLVHFASKLLQPPYLNGASRRVERALLGS